MKIFVTGGSGFIGSSFIKQAISAGHQILSMKKPSCLESFSIEEIRSFDPDVVMHCAWITTPATYQNSAYNISLKELSLKFFNLLTANNIQQFVCCGTCAEYKKTNMILDEDESIIEPQSIYAKAKADLYKEMIKKQNLGEPRITWARIFFPYGPGEHPDRLISSMIKAFQFNQTIHLQYPNAIRDYIHVDDVASALLFLCEKKVNGVFNIGTGIGTTLKNIQTILASSITQRNVNNQTNANKVHGNSDLNDSIVASVKKINALGWRHHYNISDGIKTYTQPQAINMINRK